MAAGRRVALRAVRDVTVRFCPFDGNVRSVREFLAAIGTEKARLTNSNCQIVADVRHDTSEPVVNVTFNDGEKLTMKGTNLTFKELISFFSERCAMKGDPQAQETMVSK
uniref:Large ribosomal subunit protein mL53 n=1 Tax=Callorhinchus milii TaxID=7868 RepID=V9LEX1_CALMI